MATSLYLSFTDYDLFTRREWVGLENYQRHVRRPAVAASVRVTALYVALGGPLKLAVALAVALLLDNRRRGLRASTARRSTARR